MNTNTTNADKIQAWRNDNPDTQITEQALLDILGVDSLHNANLREANLQDADLSGADLTDTNLTNAYLSGADLTDADLTDANLTNAYLMGADLTDANLTNANLTNAYLRHANLSGADLTDADLRGADLRGATLTYSTGGVTQIDNLYTYPATLQPTPDGWYARVGCWYGTLNELRKIAVSDNDDDWPEATGTEREQRRPLLQAIVSVFDAHAANHPDIINQLNNHWRE